MEEPAAEQTGKEEWSSEIEVIIEGKKVNMLVDTGSEVTIISEDLVQEIKEINQGKIIELPVKGVELIGATGVRSKRVTKQVLMEVKVGNEGMNIAFLVVKGLNTGVILGRDTIQLEGMVIDFRKNELRFLGNLGEVSVPLKKVGLRKMRSIKMIMQESEEEKIPGETRESTDLLVMRVAKKMGGEWDEKMEEVRSNALNLGIPEEGEKLIKEIESFRDVFSDQPGRARNFIGKINVEPNTPIIKKSYPIPFSKRLAVQEEINRMLTNNVIERSNSPYSNPLVVVMKPDGSIRLCLDARFINKIIIPDRESPESIDEILQRFAGTKYLSSIDLTSGYWQIELDEPSRQYTAFLFNGKNFQFRRLPFGLNISVAMFNKCMDQVLGLEGGSAAIVYVDDLLIVSANIEDHCRQLRVVLKKLQENDMTVRLKKSEFFKTGIEFLGYNISVEGISANKDKVTAIQHFPSPRNIKQLQGFLGLCNYYRKFQKNYSALTGKLASVLTTKNNWHWGEEEEKIFNEIKKRFLDTVVLKHPDFDKPFYLQTDASDIAVGVELFQEDEQGEHQVVAFASRTLSNGERNYTTTEKELLSIVFACGKFRTYLLGNKVIVRTDHQALTFLQNCRLTHGRLTRWILLLQEYHLQVEHCKGKDNVVADTLSRVETEENLQGYEDLRVWVIKSRDELKKECKNIGRYQAEDEGWKGIIEKIKNGDDLGGWFIMKEGILFKKKKGTQDGWRVCIPRILQRRVVLRCHEENGHFGVRKIISRLKESCVFPHLNELVRRIVGSCDVCQKAKCYNKKQEGLMQNVLSNGPLELVAVDLFGPLPTGRGGLKYLFVVLDVFTKLLKLYPIKIADEKTLERKILTDYLIKVGRPKLILSDHGTQFTSAKWRENLAWEGIQVGYTSVYHPQSNPVERVMRELGRIFRTYCNEKHTTWPDYVKLAENWINNNRHESTRYTPTELMFGERTERMFEKWLQFPTREVLDKQQVIKMAKRNLEISAEQRKRRHDGVIKPVEYNTGDLVLVRNHHLSSAFKGEIKKFFLLYSGPYKIIGQKMKNAYVLEDIESGNEHGTYNVIHLKPYKKEEWE